MPDTIFRFFGLRENPFKINPDPRFIFLTEKAQATLAELSYGIRTRKGLLLLTGEVGTGKTMLLRRLLDWLNDQKMPTALIFNSHINPDHLLDFILNDFGIPCESNLKSNKLLSLHRWLLERYRLGQTPVLVVDEAQGLSPHALEEVRLLLNFETPREKLLQIVLAGQPELEENLKRHDLRQLRQRITIRCQTLPLTLEQTHGYIRERLRIAGGLESIFAPEAIISLHAYAQGIPRVINVLCEHSLVNSCADGARVVSPRAVEQAASDCQLDHCESVARILNTGSYAGKSLSDLDSILAIVSGSSEFSGGSDLLKPLPALSASSPERIAGHPANANSPAQSTLPPLPAEAALPPRSSEFSMPEPEARRSVYPDQNLSRAEVVSQEQFALRNNTKFAGLLAGSLRSWRSWQTSFLAETQVVWRQFRRVIRIAEVRFWKPAQRHTTYRLLRFKSFVTRILSEPRWPQSWNRDWSGGKTKAAKWLRAMVSAAPNPSPHPGPAVRTRRQRSLSSLKRWFHEPLSSGRRANVRRSAQHDSTPQ